MIKRTLILSIFSLALLACRLFNLTGEYGNIKSFGPNDQEMNAAIQQAVETLPLFIDELNDPKPSQTFFSVKVKFLLDNGGTEHLWVDNVTYADNKFTGILGNEPVFVKGYHLGDTIVTKYSDVTDWLIIDNNRLIGGFTIHVIRDHMTDDEIYQFETDGGYIIGEEPLLP